VRSLQAAFEVLIFLFVLSEKFDCFIISLRGEGRVTKTGSRELVRKLVSLVSKKFRTDRYFAVKEA